MTKEQLITYIVNASYQPFKPIYYLYAVILLISMFLAVFLTVRFIGGDVDEALEATISITPLVILLYAMSLLLICANKLLVPSLNSTTVEAGLTFKQNWNDILFYDNYSLDDIRKNLNHEIVFTTSTGYVTYEITKDVSCKETVENSMLKTYYLTVESVSDEIKNVLSEDKLSLVLNVRIDNQIDIVLIKGKLPTDATVNQTINITAEEGSSVSLDNSVKVSE